ncbi:MAG: hypothetical protein ACFB51_16580 [Anaerolineae bacterium]
MSKRMKIGLTVGLLATAAVLFTQTAHAAADVITVVSGPTFALGHSAIAIDENDNPYIAYYSGLGGLALSVCDTPTCTNPIIRELGDLGNSAFYPNVALDSSGNPVIGSQDSSFDQLELVRCTDPTCASSTVTVVDSQGDVGQYASMALDSAVRPVFCYYDATITDLNLAVCNNLTCTNPTFRVLDASGGDVGLYTSIVLDDANRPIISYYDAATPEKLKLAVCNNPTCTNPAITTVDSGAGIGEYTSVTLTPEGLPVISYTGGIDGIYLALCNDRICSNPTIRTLQNIEAAYTSFTIGETGYPVVAYYDATNEDLKLAECTNSSCSNRNIRTLDSGGDVGEYAAIADRAVAYFDNTNLTIKLYRAYRPTLPNAGFDLPLSDWALIGGADNAQLCLTDGCAVALTGDGSTDLIRTTVPVETIPGGLWTLSFEVTGLNIASGGQMGARLEFLEGDATVATANCLAPERGTFDATTVTCPPAAAPSSYDAIRISIGWQNISGGLLFIDDVALDVTN